MMEIGKVDPRVFKRTDAKSGSSFKMFIHGVGGLRS